jgi:RNA-directed DNA polymerase
MGLIGWLLGLLGRRVVRDVSRLEGSGDRVSEVVDLDGGPLKPGHRRRALRDRRLLPKPRTVASTVRHTVGIKRQKVMTKAEADRLFAATMRTRNRALRDLVADEEQLLRLGLPRWRSEAELAAALGLSERALLRFAIHRERERTPHYITFAIPKRSGGERLIMAPKRQLKAIQRRLNELLVSRLPVSGSAHGFRPGRSIRTGAEPHVGKRMLVHLDLQDFFPSVTFARVRGLLVAYGYGYQVATSLAVIMTEAERQPVEVDGATCHVPVGQRHCVQGAPTSPGLCNAIVLRLDHRLEGLARRFGAAYTRYADDLTFSGDLDRDAAKRLMHHARAIIAAEGFRVNEGKTRLMTPAGRQSVTGVVVNRDAGLSRQERRRLRAALHRLAKDWEAGLDVADRQAALTGKLAYLRMLNPAQADRLEPPGRPLERQ